LWKAAFIKRGGGFYLHDGCASSGAGDAPAQS
jgi:hypothetical protein